MKVYTKVVMDMNFNVLEEESFEYSGPVAEAKGGSQVIQMPAQQTNSTTEVKMPVWQEEAQKDVISRAQGLMNTPLKYYPGETVQGFTPAQNAAQSMISDRAMMGSPLLSAGQKTLQNTLQGKYLNPNSNPYLKETYNQAAKGLVSNYQMGTAADERRNAMAQGAYGGDRSAIQQAVNQYGLGQNLASLGNQIYGGAYNTERGIMANAIPQSVPMSQADYYDAQQLAGVGGQQQSLGQQMIDAAVQKFNFGQTAPWEQLGMYNNLVPGGTGGTTVSVGTVPGAQMMKAK